jgi:AcrR family transcriptional regulator
MNDTRVQLLESARACVAEHGLSAVTSRMITNAAGAKLAAITYHFGSKDELVWKGLLRGVRDWLQPALDTLAGDGDPVAKSIEGIQQLLAGYDAHRAHAPALLGALVYAHHSEELRRGIVQLWNELRAHLAHSMTRMKEHNDLPGWVDPEVMATVFIAVAQGFVLQETVDPDGPEVSAMAAQFASLLIAARPAEEE